MPRAACYACRLQVGAASPLTSSAMRRTRFNRVETDEGLPLLHAAVSFFNGENKEDRLGLVNSL
jgi:hypothetical protein